MKAELDIGEDVVKKLDKIIEPILPKLGLLFKDIPSKLIKGPKGKKILSIKVGKGGAAKVPFKLNKDTLEKLEQVASQLGESPQTSEEMLMAEKGSGFFGKLFKFIGKTLLPIGAKLLQKGIQKGVSSLIGVGMKAPLSKPLRGRLDSPGSSNVRIQREPPEIKLRTKDNGYGIEPPGFSRGSGKKKATNIISRRLLNPFGVPI